MFSIKNSITLASVILFTWVAFCYAAPDLSHPAELQGLQAILLLIFFGSPLAVGLLVINFLIYTKSRIRDNRALSNFEWILLSLLFVAIFLYGLSMYMLSSSEFSSVTPETLTTQSSFVYIISSIMIALFVMCFVSLSIARFKVLYKYRWVVSIVFCILGLVTCVVIYGLQTKHNSIKKAENNDMEVSSDIEVLAEAVVEFHQKNNVFPNDLKTAFDSLDVGSNFAYNNSPQLSKNIHKYTYFRTGTDHFKICGIFSQKSTGDEYQSQDDKVHQRPYTHDKGKVCFDYSKDDINHETAIEY